MEQQLTKHTEENYSKSLVKRFMEIKVCYVQMQQKLTYAVINTCLINGNYHKNVINNHKDLGFLSQVNESMDNLTRLSLIKQQAPVHVVKFRESGHILFLKIFLAVKSRHTKDEGKEEQRKISKKFIMVPRRTRRVNHSSYKERVV